MKTRIKNLREDHDLTQKQLSKLLSVSQVAYSYYELNRRNVPLDILFRLADFYNTSIDYLLYRTDEYMPYPRSTETANNIRTDFSFK
ncbi:MAG: helix-turn-helix domain-containing protein [Christensenellales bacterium]